MAARVGFTEYAVARRPLLGAGPTFAHMGTSIPATGLTTQQPLEAASDP